MTDLLTFRYGERPVRSVLVDGEPWFVAKDVCDVLDLDDVRRAMERLDDDERSLTPLVDSAGRKQEMYIVNEPGTYSLVVASRKPEAKAFKRWITHEVIPAIRRDGMYATPALLNDPEHLLRVTQRLVEEHRARLAAQAKVAELAPKAEFHDAVATAVDAQSIRDVAKVLGTGQNRMFAWLRGEGILMADNRPYQDFLDAGYFRVIEQTWIDRDGQVHLTTKTLVTGKGLTWLQKRLHARRVGLDLVPRGVESVPTLPEMNARHTGVSPA